jgi:hypothetical protein
MQQTVTSSGFGVDDLPAELIGIRHFGLPVSGIEARDLVFVEVENATADLALGRIKAMAQELTLLVTYGNDFSIAGLGMRFDGATEHPRMAVENGAVATAFEDELCVHAAKLQKGANPRGKRLL